MTVMVSWFQGYRDIFFFFLKASAPRVRLHYTHTHSHTNHNQSLHMIGRISQSRDGKEREREGKERETWSDQNPTGDKSEESEMPCRLFPSQSLHYHVQLDGGTAQLILLHRFPLFFIFYWIKHAPVPLACGLQVYIQLYGFSHEFLGNWGLGRKLSSLQYLSASISHFDTQKRPAVWSSVQCWITPGQQQCPL